MHFLKLDVETFQGIERARLEFGSGLNILYGPNDLGKSTLATALRAALLLLPKSSEARDFSSWYADAVPRVVLTFVDDAQHYWQIKKSFGDGTTASAELLHSKDGRTFSVDCRNREVDERIRSLLRLGIPAPGGTRAPRGLPESFLANALFAAQTDVDTILAASLEKDLDDSGKVRLQKALATLAQDPQFKAVLSVAQEECDKYFTATGKLKRAQGSMLVEVQDAIKRHGRELEELERELRQSHDTEQAVDALQAKRAEALATLAHSEDALRVAKIGATNASARRLAERELDQTKRALADMDAHAARVKSLERDKLLLDRRVTEEEIRLAAVSAECDQAEAQLRAAEEALRVTASEAGEQERQLRAAELSATLEGLRARRLELDAEREKAQRALGTLTAERTAMAQVDTARARHGQLQRDREQGCTAAEAAERELQHAKSLLAFGRYHVAALAAQRASETRERAGGYRGQAASKERETSELEERAKEVEQGLTERRAQLPSRAELKSLQQIKYALEVAEAALGGGLTLALQPRAPVTIVAASDGVEPETSSLSAERVFEAQRTLRLAVADLVDIEVMAGAPEKRRNVEDLRSRWQADSAPVLQRAGLKSLAQVTAALDELEKTEASLRELRISANATREAAKNLVERAEALEREATQGAVEPQELVARKAALGSADLEACELQWTKLGKTWESQTEALCRAREKAAGDARAKVTKLDSELSLAGYHVGEAERMASQRAGEADVCRAALAGQDAEARLRELSAALQSVIRQTEQAAESRRALEAEASAAREHAEAAVKSALANLEKARERQAILRTAVDAARAARDTKHGEWMAQAEALQKMRREDALALLNEKTAAFAALPMSPLASDAELQAAHDDCERAGRALATCSEELHKAEGALTKVGGAQLRERARQVREALEAVRTRETELEIEAKAWKLLHETLRAAEDAEGAHLGRALSGPVGERFAELTHGRYAHVRFDPLLRAQDVDAVGAVESAKVLAALSVGTRDQLATLVRMTIASQLKLALILDDHLVHTDPTRLAWFRQALIKTAVEAQVLVFTCRPQDYLEPDELPVSAALRDLAGGTVRAVNLAELVRRWGTKVRTDSEQASAPGV